MKILPARQVCSLPSAVNLVRHCTALCHDLDAADQGHRGHERSQSPAHVGCGQNCCSMHTSAANRTESNYPSMVKMSSFTLNSNGDDLKRFLEEVGTNAKEARFWLRHFQRSSEPCHPFAIIQLEPDIMKQPLLLEQLASSIAFLHRHSMKCVITHGCPPSVDQSDMPRILSEMSAFSMQLVSILEHQGALVRPLFAGNGVLMAESESGCSGRLTTVAPQVVKWALRSGHVPIIPCVGQTPNGQLLLLDVQQTTAELSKAMHPLKVMFVNSTGGFTNDRKEIVANVNLPHDLDYVHSQPWCTSVIQNKVKFINHLLESLPSQTSVVITSAQALLTELFTHHGSGTFFKIMEPVHKYTSLEGIDRKKFIKLIERGFGHDLHEDYLEKITPHIHKIYLLEGYSGAAIISKKSETSIPYLDKFVVLASKQGENVGQMLWEQIRKDYPSLYWRSRNTNLINPWYFQRSEGSWTNGAWTVFWYGCATHKASSLLIDDALSLPSSFKKDCGPSQTVPNIAFGK